MDSYDAYPWQMKVILQTAMHDAYPNESNITDSYNGFLINGSNITDSYAVFSINASNITDSDEPVVLVMPGETAFLY